MCAASLNVPQSHNGTDARSSLQHTKPHVNHLQICKFTRWTLIRVREAISLARPRVRACAHAFKRTDACCALLSMLSYVFQSLCLCALHFIRSTGTLDGLHDGLVLYCAALAAAAVGHRRRQRSCCPSSSLSSSRWVRSHRTRSESTNLRRYTHTNSTGDGG